MDSPDAALEQIKREQRDPPAQGAEQDELPPQTVLEIDVTDTRKRRYQTKAIYRVPNLQDQIRIGQLKAVYLPNGTPDPQVISLVDAVCYLTVTLSFNEQYPEPSWWKDRMQLYDVTPLFALYGRALDYERKFLGDSEDDRAGQGDGSVASEQGRDDRDGQAHVGRKIQAPPERSETLVSHGEGGA